MRLRFASSIVKLSCGAAMTALTGTAYADADTAQMGEAIVVTAQKREQRADDVPMALSVVEDAHNIADMDDVAASVPGLTAAPSFRGPPVYTLRGVGFNSQNLSATSPVGIYYDEVAYPYPAMSEGPLFDIDRIEVVKGPQGTLFGRSTTGGLVNHVTRKPSDRAEGYVTLRGGSYESYGVEGAVNVPLGDNLSARLAARGDRADKGWQYSVSHGDRLGKVDRQGARLSLLWEPGNDASILLTGNWWRDRSETQAPQPFRFYPQGLIAAGIAPDDWYAQGTAIGLPPEFFAQGFDPDKAGKTDFPVRQLPWGGTTATSAPLDFRKDNALAALSLRGDFTLADGVSLTLLSSYSHFDRDDVREGAGFTIENAILQGLGEIESQSHELRLASEGDGYSWIAGIAYSRDEVEDLDRSWVGSNSTLQLVRAYASQFGATPAEQGEIFYGARDAESRSWQLTDSYAVFGQADLAIAPDVSLTLGGRYSRDHIRFSGCSGDIGDGNLVVTLNAYYSSLGISSTLGPGDCVTFLGDIAEPLFSAGAIPFPPQGRFSDRLTEDSLSGRAALSWRPSSDLMLYGSVARGTKAGVYPNIEANLASQYAPATQEKLLTFEIGAKGTLADWLQYDAAAYYYDYRDKQVFGAVSDILFTSLTRIVNIPRSHVYGLDAHILARPSADWRFAGAMALMKTRIDEYSGYDDYGTYRNFEGGRFPYSPGLQISLSATRGFALDERWRAEAGLTVRHSSEAFADMRGEDVFRLRPYATVDTSLLLARDGGDLEVAIDVKNLFDEYYWNSVHLQSDSFTRYAAMPRTWRLSVSKRF